MKRIALPLALATSALAQHHHSSEHTLRLIVSDGKTNVLNVVDAHDGNIVSSFGTPGRLSGLETGPSGQYAYAIHRDDHRLTVLDSGLSTVSHGDHNDLQEKTPYILATLNTGRQPTHFLVSGDLINVFNDGDGTVAIFGEDLLGKTNDMNIIKVTKPDHGAPLLIGDVLLSGHLTLNRADAYDIKSGRLIKQLPTCTALHGGTVIGDTAFFGCKEGVQVLTVKGQDIQARMIPNPAGTPAGNRVGMFTHAETPFTFADFGKGVARLTPSSEALKVTALSGKPRTFELSEDGKALVVFTNDGQLHKLSAVTGQVLKSVRLVNTFEEGEKAGIRPDMALAGDRVYVTSPETGEVLEVNLADLSVTRRIKVGGTPSFITVTHAEGIHH